MTLDELITQLEELEKEYHDQFTQRSTVEMNQNFQDFLIYCGFDITTLPQLVTVTTNYDEEHDMIQILIEDICVHGGGYSDIHNGCFPHPYIGDYNNEDEFINLLKNGLISLNLNVTFKKGLF